MNVLNVPFVRNFVSMYFCKVVSLHLEHYKVIIQCLRTFTLTGVWSYCTCLHLQGFLANIFWNITGNCYRRRPFLALANVKFKWTKQSCPTSKISQSTVIQWRNRNIKQLCLWRQERRQEKLCSFNKARNPLIKKKDIGNGQYILTIFQSLYLDQVSLSRDFKQNVLQSCLVETSFGK